MDIFSNLQVIGECLLDKQRVKVFEKAIKEVVRRDDIVMDIGTGSGILALLSAKAGAKKVFAVEIAKDVAEFARLNIKSNGLTDKIEVISADIKHFNFPHGIDVVTAELLDTCLIAEQQAHALNSLREKKIIDSATRLIPYRLDCAVELIEYDFNFYGFQMPFVIQARNFETNQKVVQKLSSVVVFKQVDFNKFIEVDVLEKIVIKVEQDGLLNAIRLTSKTYLSSDVSIWSTPDMNMPVIVPLHPQRVRKGEEIILEIKYRMGEGFGKFSTSVQIT
ncbi:50S ribosomal protein L11 methyltransferase [Candidatus Daviesbacteria bacterium]|nr:50S ribosomal protein L11 methyltransferase [Candidatus Daviesbacteria bacterium]